MFSDEAGTGAVEPDAVLWKSKKFGTKLKYIASGDIDNDGNNEIAFLLVTHSGY